MGWSVAVAAGSIILAFLAALSLGAHALDGPYHGYTLWTPGAIAYNVVLGFFATLGIVLLRLGSPRSNPSALSRAIAAGAIGALLLHLVDSGSDWAGVIADGDLAVGLRAALFPSVLAFPIVLSVPPNTGRWARVALTLICAAGGSCAGTSIAYLGGIAIDIGAGSDGKRNAFTSLAKWACGDFVALLILVYCFCIAERMFRGAWVRVREFGLWTRDYEIEGSASPGIGATLSRETAVGSGDAMALERGGKIYLARHDPAGSGSLNSYPGGLQMLKDGDTVQIGPHTGVFCEPIDFFAGWPPSNPSIDA